MASQFSRVSLPYLANPFGIVFNPMAIERLLSLAVNQEELTTQDVFENNGVWNSFLAHSKVYSLSSGQLLTNLNQLILSLYEYLKTAQHLIITYGTAWVYRHIESDQLVANCHKLPNKKFLKELLTPDQIAESLAASIAIVKTINPTIVTVATVSPIRHIKDGMVQNSQSKAHLLAGIHQIIEPKSNVLYFPSYEIMMDELRDYRFYKEDLIHPNDQAIAYIWERFIGSFMTKNTQDLMQEVTQLKTALAHKPIQPNSSAHSDFAQQLEQKIVAFKQNHPHIIL
jgi:hypothetical protein